MANYLSLDEAAKHLGLSTNELIEMRSRGEIFGFRDGTSWKFKTEEIERVRQEISGDVLDDDAGGSSILVSERPGSSSKSGIVLSPDAGKGASTSDLILGDESDAGSDVALVPDPSSGSGLRLVNRGAGKTPRPTDDSELRLEGDDELEVDASSLSLGGEDGLGMGMGSELRLADDVSSKSSPSKAAGDSDVIGGSDLNLQSSAKGGSPDLILDGSDDGFVLGDELKLSDDDDDDIVLHSGSDLALAAESGINLTDPSDSGISLEEDAPLDLEGAGISGLELGSDISGGSDPGGSGAGISGIDFGAAGEDFQLSPSGGFDAEEDSGSQVIEVEDSTELGGGFPADDFGAPMGEGGFADEGLAIGSGTGAAGAVAYRSSPEIPLSAMEVTVLLVIVLVMGICGLLVTDIVRNMWAWSNTDSSITSWFTKMIIESIGMQS
jgi:hypothetical protein